MFQLKPKRIPHGSSGPTMEESTMAMALLEEHWFFHNILSGSSKNRNLCPTSGDGNGNSSKPTKFLLPESGSSHRNSARGSSLRLEKIVVIQEESSSSSVVKSKMVQRVSASLDQFISKPQTHLKDAQRVKDKAYYVYDNNHQMGHPRRGKRALEVKKWKSLSDLGSEEVQGFMDLGFVFDKERLSPVLLNMLPGLCEKNHGGCEVDDKARRPYLSETWLVRRSVAPVFNCIRRRPVGDVKEQLKYWARAVAANIR